MSLISQFGNVDLAILVVCFLSIGLFFFAGLEILFKFYFGIIIGFLLFLYFNSEIALISYVQEEKVLTGWQNFLFKNGSFVLSFFALMIPVFGVFFASSDGMSFHTSKKFLQVCIFGFLLPIFLYGILVYIIQNLAISLSFFTDVGKAIANSALTHLFKENSYLLFFALLGILFYRIILGFVFTLVSSFFKASKENFVAGAAQDDQEDEHEEEKNDDHHGHHH